MMTEFKVRSIPLPSASEIFVLGMTSVTAPTKATAQLCFSLTVEHSLLSVAIDTQSL
jgi:hypothetical protein